MTEFLNKINTGSKDINLWLDGGYEKGIITLFYGPPASGKSNFVILASCTIAREKKVIFIDTEGSFSIDRVKKISGNNFDSLLKNIILLKPMNFLEQKKIFLKLSRNLESKNIGLIVVDSMTMLYRLELGEAREKGLNQIKKTNLDLTKQMHKLYEIARKLNIPIIITAQVYTDFLNYENSNKKEPNINIVGGDILKYWSKCIIELKNKNGKRKAILKKHRSIKESELNFDIINEGIKKRTFFDLRF